MLGEDTHRLLWMSVTQDVERHSLSCLSLASLKEHGSHFPVAWGPGVVGIYWLDHNGVFFDTRFAASVQGSVVASRRMSEWHVVADLPFPCQRILLLLSSPVRSGTHACAV